MTAPRTSANPPPSPEEILAGQTRTGGWTRATLAGWGVSWPPPKGWRQKLEDDYARHEGENRAAQDATEARIWFRAEIFADAGYGVVEAINDD